MDIIKTVAKNLRKYKNLRRTSFLKIAQKADIPYSSLENIIYQRINDTTISTLLKISKALDVKIDDLLK
jgi:DNA-binding Xre family transcriptional regulator